MVAEDRKTLFVYALPPGTQALRLANEERQIDDVMRDCKIPRNYKVTLRGATVHDIYKAVTRYKFEIIHFSGHGTPGGIVLDTKDYNQYHELDAKGLDMVLRASAECLRVLICITCFSHEVLQKISELVPFVIAIDGPVDDNAAVEFVGAFYQSFFTTGRIERSFTAAKDFVEQLYGETCSARINPRLLRSFDRRRGATLVTVHLREGGDPLVMDISEAETSVNGLGMFTDHFVSILTRKVRFHRFLFDLPRERAILQIGPLFGIFSWKSADRVVVCHDVFRLAPHADARLAEWWASLVANYNDWLLEPYRLSQNTRNRLSPDSYKASLNKMRSYLLANTVKDRGRRGHGKELRLLEKNLVETLGGSAIIFAMMQTAEQNLKLAQQNFSESKIDRVASCLEQMVSSIHDIINYLGDALAEKKGIIGHSK